MKHHIVSVKHNDDDRADLEQSIRASVQTHFTRRKSSREMKDSLSRVDARSNFDRLEHTLDHVRKCAKSPLEFICARLYSCRMNSRCLHVTGLVHCNSTDLTLEQPSKVRREKTNKSPSVTNYQLSAVSSVSSPSLTCANEIRSFLFCIISARPIIGWSNSTFNISRTSDEFISHHKNFNLASNQLFWDLMRWKRANKNIRVNEEFRARASIHFHYQYNLQTGGIE